MYVHTHVYMYINTYTYTYTCIMTFEHLVPAPAQADASRCCTPDKNSRKSVPQHFCYAKPPYRGLSYFPEMHTGFFTARATIEHVHNFVFIMQSLCIEDFQTAKKNSHQLLRRASHRHSICGFWPKTGRNSQTSIHQHIYYVAFFFCCGFWPTTGRNSQT